MAVEESIKIKIQANAEEFKVVSDIINKELGKLGKNFEILEGNIKQSTAAMNQFEGSSKKFNKGLMSISLILQDLPYGFRGIQNNIPALAQGLGVVYLAVSAVTAAMTYFVMQGDKMSESTKKIYDSFKSFVNGVASELYNALGPAFKSIVESLKELWGLFGVYIVDIFKNSWSTVINVLRNAGQILAETLKAIVAILKGDWTGLGQALVNILKRAANLIIDVFDNLMIVTGNVKAAIVGLFSKDLANVVKSETLAASKEFTKKFKFAFEETKTGAVDLFSLFKSEPKKAKKELSDLEKTLENLEVQQRKINVLFFEFQQISQMDYIEGQIKALSSAIDDLAGQTTDAAIKKLQELISLRGEYYIQQISIKGKNVNPEITPVEEPKTPDTQPISAQFKAHMYIAKTFFDSIKQKFKDLKKEAKESQDFLMKIGIGMMNALGPALDLLLEKGASVGEVLSTALEDVVKKLVKVAIAAAVVVALLAAFGFVDVAKIPETFGMLFGQGMGLSPELFKKSMDTGGGKGIAAVDKIKGGSTTGSTLSTKISGNDLLILMNKAERNNQSTF